MTVVHAECGCSTDCDGCFEHLRDGDHAFCENCRTLPEGHIEPEDGADYLREWVRAQRLRLTDVEVGLLERVADHIEHETMP